MLLKRGIRFLPVSDPEYPARLQEIPDAPQGIYVRGGLPEEGTPSVAVIGARMCSEYGKQAARYFASALAAAGVQVVSGLARGIDGISQEAALDCGGRTYAVLGCGVDVCYPAENGGCLTGYLRGAELCPNIRREPSPRQDCSRPETVSSAACPT